jgi:hypothetical protein
MSIINLYQDVFFCVCDFLEYDEIVRLATTNKQIYQLCNEFIIYSLHVSIRELPYFSCDHMIDREQHIKCKRLDNHSIQFIYCQEHELQHTCWDCGRTKPLLDKTNACSTIDCCFKYVCSYLEGGCLPLICSECQQLIPIENLSFLAMNKDILFCDDCVLERNTNDSYVPMVYWHVLPLEDMEYT